MIEFPQWRQEQVPWSPLLGDWFIVNLAKFCRGSDVRPVRGLIITEIRKKDQNSSNHLSNKFDITTAKTS